MFPPPLSKMPWHKRLRWRLVGSQFLVVLVGVTIMLLATAVILQHAPVLLQSSLTALVQNPQQLPQITDTLLLSFGRVVSLSVLVAALAAATTGTITSIWLWRSIITPLRRAADSSQRVADGRYTERMEVPENSGEAMIQLVTSLNMMAEALARVEQQRIELLGNITHELRTPLAGLKGYLEGLMDGLFPPNEETFAWMLQEIDRLQRLVNDLQSLSQVEAGQFNLALQPFAVQSVALRVMEQLRPQAQAIGVTLANEWPKTAVTVHADPDRTAQIMLNLVGNALRYTPPGGHITLAIGIDGRFAQVQVRDTGIGIPPALLPYVFERFYRVDVSRSRASGGSGIGLTISRHLVWAMGGEITATSAGEGQGSTFSFTLPLDPLTQSLQTSYADFANGRYTPS